jgi:hypothetical protein
LFVAPARNQWPRRFPPKALNVEPQFSPGATVPPVWPRITPSRTAHTPPTAPPRENQLPFESMRVNRIELTTGPVPLIGMPSWITTTSSTARMPSIAVLGFSVSPSANQCAPSGVPPTSERPKLSQVSVPIVLTPDWRKEVWPRK